MEKNLIVDHESAELGVRYDQRIRQHDWVSRGLDWEIQEEEDKKTRARISNSYIGTLIAQKGLAMMITNLLRGDGT